MSAVVWLRRDVILAVHRRQLSEHGGPEGVRDEAALQSALARPLNAEAYQSSKADLAFLAAAYAFGIARNHPFVDGNKRTAFVACRLFLLLNGYDLSAASEDRYRMFYMLADGDVSEDALAEWIRSHLIKAD